MSAPERVLGVGKAATREQVKSAHRRLAHQFHPDQNPGDRLAARRWLELQAAYEAFEARWSAEDAPPQGPATSERPEGPKASAATSQAAEAAKDLTKPFVLGMLGLLADAVKRTMAKPAAGGFVREIASKAGQAAVDEAAIKARAQIEDLLKRG